MNFLEFRTKMFKAKSRSDAQTENQKKCIPPLIPHELEDRAQLLKILSTYCIVN